MDVESSAVTFAPGTRSYNGPSGRERTYYSYSGPGKSGIRSPAEFNYVPNPTYGGGPITIPKANLWSSRSNELNVRSIPVSKRGHPLPPPGPYSTNAKMDPLGGMLVQNVLSNPESLDYMPHSQQAILFSKLLENPNAYPFENIYTGSDGRLWIQYSPIAVYPTNPSNPYDKSQYSTLLTPHMPIVNAIRLGLRLPVKGGARRTRNKRKARRKTNRKYKRSPTKALTAGAHK